MIAKLPLAGGSAKGLPSVCDSRKIKKIANVSAEIPLAIRVVSAAVQANNRPIGPISLPGFADNPRLQTSRTDVDSSVPSLRPGIEIPHSGVACRSEIRLAASIHGKPCFSS